MGTTLRKKRFLAIGLLLIGVIIGGALFGYGSFYYWLGLYSSYIADWRAIDIKDKVALLTRLRTGETDQAIEYLERALDSELILYSDGLIKADRKSKRIKESVKAARDYRTKFPRSKNDPAVNEAMSEALAENDK